MPESEASNLMSEAMEEHPLTRLQEVVQGLLDGVSSVDDLVGVLDQTRERLKQLRRDFRATVEHEGPEARDLASPEIQAVEGAFGDYFEVLDSCAGYLHNFERAYLESALSDLAPAVERLNLDFVRFREAALAGRGPTTHPGLNCLHRLAAALAEDPDEAARHALEGQVALEQERCQVGLASLDGDSSAPLEPAMRSFYTDYFDLLADPAPLEQWMESLVELGRRYARVDVAFLSRRYHQKPTAVPPLNLVINGAWLFSQDAVELEVVQVFLTRALETTEIAREMQTQLLLGLDPDHPSRPETLKLVEALESVALCLEDYADWLEDPQPSQLDELLRRAREHALGVTEAFDAVKRGPVQTTAICPICGLGNPVETRRCRQCGAVLTVGAGFAATEGRPAPVTGLAAANRFVRLLETAENVLRNVDPVEFLLGQLQELEQARQLAARSQVSLDTVSGGTPAGRTVLEAAALTYREGLDELGRSLALLQEFAQEPSVELLAEARDSLESAAEKLQAVNRQIGSITQD